MKFAAIDIGSNAVRLIFINVYETPSGPQFVKDAMYRVALRLGEEVFIKGKISARKEAEMLATMKAFKHLIDVHQPVQIMACATSAMRDAKNAKEIVNKVYKKTGIDIKIISGQKEAEFIFSNHVEKFQLDFQKNYLYIDVGGGSTEFTLFSHGKMITSRSFKAGTVRLLNEMVHDVVWEEIEKWIRTNTADYEEVTLIGSGGNINKLFKMSGKQQDKPLSYIYINSQYAYLSSLTYEQRISQLGLNSDRADVIVPATRIYLNAMKWSGARQIYVPKIGLSDGIVKAMYYGKI